MTLEQRMEWMALDAEAELTRNPVKRAALRRKMQEMEDADTQQQQQPTTNERSGNNGRTN